MCISAFLKCYLDDICVHKTMTVFDWIEKSKSLGVTHTFNVQRKDAIAFVKSLGDGLSADGGVLSVDRMARSVCEDGRRRKY